MATHSKRGASSMYRWGPTACPGSVNLIGDEQSPTSFYAAEGTVAHGIAEKILRTANVYSPVGLRQEEAGHSVEITQDMMDAVGVYVDYVFRLPEVVGKIGVEVSLDLSEIHPGLFGTADCVALEKHTRTLHVIDYKHGAGKPVEVENNSQLKYYALGALLSPEFRNQGVCEVKMTIVQPRCHHADGPIRTYAMSALDLLEWADDLKKAVLATEKPDAPLVSGPHCDFCTAAYRCPELNAQAQRLATISFSPVEAYSSEDLAKALRFKPALQAWIRSVDEFAYREAEAGRIPPGFKLVAKRANRSWRDEQDAKAALLKYGFDAVDIQEAPALLSPAKIEKKLPKEDKALLEDLTEKVSSGNALVPIEDKRESRLSMLAFTPVEGTK